MDRTGNGVVRGSPISSFDSNAVGMGAIGGVIIDVSGTIWFGVALRVRQRAANDWDLILGKLGSEYRKFRSLWGLISGVLGASCVPNIRFGALFSICQRVHDSRKDKPPNASKPV